MGTVIAKLRTASLALLLLSSAGCVNPFSPAKPPKPDPNAFVEDFRTPSNLLHTIEQAISARSPAGSAGYIDAMADSTTADTRAFYAFHDPAVQRDWANTTHHDPPDPWDLNLERRFYNYLITLPEVPADYDYVFVFGEDNTSPADQIDDAGGSALLHRSYALIAANSKGDSRNIAIGYVDLYLAKYNARWYVYRWQDRLDPAVGVSDPDNRTMGWRRLDSQAS